MAAAKVRIKHEQSRQTRLVTEKKMNNTITLLCQATQAANIALAANQNWGQKNK